ncbi:MAG: hypothetical protein KDA73_01430 [Rhodobacteraceae bacterium]|nr:hypothetical protein [Paracoccaceae bacterium]
MHVLIYREGAGLDANKLAFLYRHLGDREADLLICDAMEDLALALARVSRAKAQDDLATVAEQTLILEQIGARVGLEKLRRVAADVRCCAAAGPGAALEATLARLARIGDLSLAAIWDPKDASM